MESQEEFESNCLLQLMQLIQEKEGEDPLLKKAINDKVLIKCNLIGRKFDVDFAFETIKGYLNGRYIKYPGVYELPVSSVRHVLESGVGGILKSKDENGDWVLVGRLGGLDLETMSWELLTRAAISVIEYLWGEEENVRRGQVLIGDADTFSLKIFRNYTTKQYLASLDIFYRNYPSSVKSVHGVNTSSLLHYTYSMFKNLVPGKLGTRVHLHGKNLKGLHEHVSPTILPIWLGGDLRDEEAFDFDIIQHILDQQGL